MSCDIGEATRSLENDHFTYIRTHSPTLLSLYLRHSSFSKLFVASPTSQLVLQPFHRLRIIDTKIDKPKAPSFSNSSVALPTSQLILQPFCCFIYVTVHSPTLFYFSYITSSSLNSPGKPLMLVLLVLIVGIL